MAKAIWNGKVIAESDETIMVEGNHYFPPKSLNLEYFEDSTTHTVCPWKGLASYHNITDNSKTNKNAAWYYPEPSVAAEEIKDFVAFWRGVRVEA